MILFNNFSKFLKFENITTDGFVFRLFYKMAVLVHFVVVLLLGTKQYFGEPIDCDSTTNTVPRSVMNTYCWIEGTWTVKQYLFPWLDFNDIPHPGVGVEKEGGKWTRIWHKYYQWVPLVLSCYVAVFYLPRWIWKNIEGGRMKHLCEGLEKQPHDDEKDIDNVRRITRYWQPIFNYNSAYFTKYLFVAYVLNSLCLVLVWWFTNLLLEGRFNDYGIKAWIYYTREEYLSDYVPVNPLEEVFPKVAKCLYRRFGYTATIEKNAALCLIPLNILNEKIFALLWFLYLFLAICVGIGFLNRVLLIVVRPYRLLYYAVSLNITWDVVKKLDESFTHADWFVFAQLGKNLDSTTFTALVEEIFLDILFKEGKDRNSEGCWSDPNVRSAKKSLVQKVRRMFEKKYFKEKDLYADDSKTPLMSCA